VTACKGFDLLLPLHAAGALDPDEAARVEAHLAACAACRREAALDAEALLLAKLPPPSDAERRAVADVPRRALAALHAADRRRSRWKPVAAGIGVAAAALLAILAPAMLQRAPELPRTATVAVAAASWEEPDLDTLWDEAGVLDDEASSTTWDESDAALAALDL
jgi:anti-sigma factor RsiW